ncbi:hypothetical protein ACX0G9_04265 [Flavitalea flava]
MKQTILLVAVCMAIVSTNAYAKTDNRAANEETPSKKSSTAVRHILSDKLPAKLLTTIKKEYKSYWITGLYRETTNGKNSYHITLENADRIVTLSAASSATWSLDRAVSKDQAAL